MSRNVQYANYALNDLHNYCDTPLESCDSGFFVLDTQYYRKYERSHRPF